MVWMAHEVDVMKTHRSATIECGGQHTLVDVGGVGLLARLGALLLLTASGGGLLASLLLGVGGCLASWCLSGGGGSLRDQKSALARF